MPTPAAPDSPRSPLPVVGRIAGAISTYEAVVALATKARRWVRGLTEYVTTIDSSDDMYNVVLAAVLARLPHDQRRSIAMHTGRTEAIAVPVDCESTSADSRHAREVTWAYDGSRTSTLEIGGHRIACTLTDESSTALGERLLLRRSVQFTSPNVEARDALHAWLLDLVAEVRTSRPPMRIASIWGHWQHRGDVPHRDLDTVVLDGDQKERLVADVADFIAAEAVYARLGVPYHRGYLLHGPPGTGKTSVTKAIASHFGMGLFYVPLADLQRDADLLQLVSDVPARSVLLLEDVDINSSATERTDETKHASLSGLLNALDGVFTPHGLITFMTTNHRDALDEGVVRPGRVDVELRLGMATADQLDRLWQLAYGRPPSTMGERPMLHTAIGHAPSAIVDVLRRHLDDSYAAATEFATWGLEQALIG